MNLYGFLTILVVCVTLAYLQRRFEGQLDKFLDRPVVAKPTAWPSTKKLVEKWSQPVEPDETKHEVKVDLSQFEEDWRDEEQVAEES